MLQVLWINTESTTKDINYEREENMMCKKELSDEEILNLARAERPISREELGINTPKSKDGLQALNEGVEILKFSDDDQDT